VPPSCYSFSAPCRSTVGGTLHRYLYNLISVQPSSVLTHCSSVLTMSRSLTIPRLQITNHSCCCAFGMNCFSITSASFSQSVTFTLASFSRCHFAFLSTISDPLLFESSIQGSKLVCSVNPLPARLTSHTLYPALIRSYFYFFHSFSVPATCS